MKKRTELLVGGFLANKKKRRRWLAIVTSLAVLTGGNVYWALREIGLALNDEELTEAENQALNELGQTETETPELWEMTFPASEDTPRQEQIALIAESQLGYTESQQDFIPDEAGNPNGYTRYGEWYGNPYGEWNTMFTYFCMYYAGVETSEIPYGGNAYTWQTKLEENGLLSPPETIPVRGNIILLDTDADGNADRTGIITGSDALLTVIEGDTADAVAEVQYAPDDTQIIGYVIISEPETAEETEDLQTETPRLTYSAESPAGIQVSASAESGTFPPDAYMTVTDISREQALQTAAESPDFEPLDAVAVDISFYTEDGIELEPTGSVAVQIILPETLTLPAGEYALLHVSESGDVETVTEAAVSENGAEFTAEAFSLYVLTSNVAVDVNNAIMVNGQRGDNSRENPFVIGIGETLEVWYDGEDYNSCNFTVVGNDFPNDVHRIVRDTDFQEWNSATGFDRIEDNMRKAKFIGSTLSEDSDDCYIVVRKNNVDIARLYIKVIERPVFMIMNGGSRLLLDDALIELNKTAEFKTLYMNEGDTFTLGVNGYNSHLIGWDGTNTYDYSKEYKLPDNNGKENTLQRGAPQYEEGNTYVTFTCLKHGTVTFKVNGYDVTVEIEHPIYVVENIQERDIDRINEWVSTSYWLPKQGGYVPNSSLYYPYQLYDGDTLTLRIPKGDLIGPYLRIAENSPLTIATGFLHCVNDEINISFVAHNQTDEDIDTAITLYNYDAQPIRTMYVRVPHRSRELLDHADIEIADGGKYTVTKLKRNADGTITKTVTEYRAYIAGVNSSTLYSSKDDSTPCDFYYTATYFVDAYGNRYYTATSRKEGDVTKWYVWVNGHEIEVEEKAIPTLFDNSGSVTLTSAADNGATRTYNEYTATVRTGITGYLEQDYHVDPKIAPGAPQYEFTSKYRITENGEYVDWSNIKYYPAEVDHVVFDVKVALEPSLETVYQQSNGAWVQESSRDLTGAETQHLDSVKFPMNHQAVLDAYNKCPNHTGLDFTIMAYSAIIEFDLNKELTGGTIQANQFEFEVVQQEVEPVRAWGDYSARLVSKTGELVQKYSSLKVQGAYQVFYYDFDHQNVYWGNGINSTAALNELQSISGFSSLQTPADVFDIANNDNSPDQRTVLNILKKYLTEPNYTVTAENYVMNQEGFFLLAFESETIQTVTNDANGIVKFNALHFEQTGIYDFIIREKRGSASDILYDNSVIGLQVNVEKGAQNQLTADILSDISAFSFTNHVTFRLPDTGGTGKMPYAVGGTVMITAALLLLLKRKEDS